MTMTRFIGLAIAGCIASTLLSTPAYAGPIIPDPTPGIRGGDDPEGTPGVTNGSVFALTNDACSDFAALADFFCAQYINNTGESLFALDFSFWDASGQPILATEGNFPFASVESDFQLIRYPNQFFGDPFNDPYTLRLCADDPSSGGPAACNVIISDGDAVIDPGETLAAFFEEHPGFASLRAWNVTNLNDPLPENSVPVPEPMTLTLFGSGLLGLVARHRRRRGDL